MQGFFNVQESKGDLTQDHYLNSPPIEPSLKEFSHTRKIPRWSGRDSNPRLRAQRQARSPLSHQTTLVPLRVHPGKAPRLSPFVVSIRDVNKPITDFLSHSNILSHPAGNLDPLSDDADPCIEGGGGGSNMVAVAIFMVAQFCIGCGGSPLFTLGTTYIDDHVRRESSAM